MARSALTSMVILLGAAMGWWIRKASGPKLVSEAVAARPAVGPKVPASPKGQPDAAGRAWLGEAQAMSSPSASLVALQQAIDAGRISDFGRLARELVMHPLPRFRREAMLMVFPAWGRENPEQALRFFIDYEVELEVIDGRRKARHTEGVVEQAEVVARGWAQRDPLAAMRFLRPEDVIDGIPYAGWPGAVVDGLARPGAPASPDLKERLTSLASIHGEAAALNLLQRVRYDGWWERWGDRRPSAEELKELAARATNSQLKQEYQAAALDAWYRERDRGGAPADGVAWLGQVVSPGIDAAQASRRSTDELVEGLRSSNQESALLAEWNVTFAALLHKDMDAARALLEDPAMAARVDAETLGRVLIHKDQAALPALLKLLPDAEQRQETIRRVLLPQSFPATADQLVTSVERGLSYGADGDAAVVGFLTERVRSAAMAQHVPEVFAGLPPDVQARVRMDVVLGLGNRAPDVAAELWMDATPAELAQPGAAVVAEEVAVRLLRRDPEVGSAWVQQLPPGESRDRAVARMIEAMVRKDPESCAEWAATLTDPAAQTRAAKALATRTEPRRPE